MPVSWSQEDGLWVMLMAEVSVWVSPWLCPYYRHTALWCALCLSPQPCGVLVHSLCPIEV